MNRRELLSLLPAAFALTDLPHFPEPSVPANASQPDQPDPIRRQFLEARSKGNFWYGLYQWAEALSYFRQAWDPAQQCASNEEKAEVLSRLSYCEGELLASRYWLGKNTRKVASRWTWSGCDNLIFHLQKIGSHSEVLDACRAGLRRPSAQNWFRQRVLLANAAFSSYCIGDYEEAFRLCCQVPDGEGLAFPSGPPYLLGYKILYLCGLRDARSAERSAQEYVSRYGRLPSPQRIVLREIGIDADEIYLKFQNCAFQTLHNSVVVS